MTCRFSSSCFHLKLDIQSWNFNTKKENDTRLLRNSTSLTRLASLEWTCIEACQGQTMAEALGGADGVGPGQLECNLRVAGLKARRAGRERKRVRGRESLRKRVEERMCVWERVWEREGFKREKDLREMGLRKRRGDEIKGREWPVLRRDVGRGVHPFWSREGDARKWVFWLGLRLGFNYGLEICLI